MAIKGAKPFEVAPGLYSPNLASSHSQTQARTHSYSIPPTNFHILSTAGNFCICLPGLLYDLCSPPDAWCPMPESPIPIPIPFLRPVGGWMYVNLMTYSPKWATHRPHGHPFYICDRTLARNDFFLCSSDGLRASIWYSDDVQIRFVCVVWMAIGIGGEGFLFEGVLRYQGYFRLLNLSM